MTARVVRRVVHRLPMLVWLTVVWVALWGDVSVANALSGLAVAVAVLAAFDVPGVPTGVARVRPVRALSFAGYFVYDLVVSTLSVAGHALLPPRTLRTAVVEVPVRDVSDGLLTTVANTISLTPGTLTLEVDRARGVLFVHVLHVGNIAALQRGVENMERRAIQAFGSPAALRALDRPHEPPHEHEARCGPPAQSAAHP